ncbi:MAG TPA: Rnase Y domain-containing protein [Bdellovibrionota bacterium]|nr:Rnase Y domain-containing protein [Bdellovibrionota bacterium]
MEHVYIYISLLVIPLSVLVSYLVLNQWRFIRFSGSLKLAENQGHQLLLASEKNAREILDKAEVRASSEKESLKKKLTQEIQDRKKELEDVYTALSEREANIEPRFKYIDQRYEKLLDFERTLANNKQDVEKIRSKCEDLRTHIIEQLARKAEVSVEEARNDYLKLITDEAKHHEAKRAKEEEEEQLSQAERHAKKIMTEACQRFTGEPIIAKPPTFLSLEGSKLKGKIIGRNGRNIKAFQTFTGIALELNEQPGMVGIVTQDSFKKEVARQALLRLIREDQFNPNYIEKVIKEIEFRLRRQAIEDGKEAFKLLRMGQASQEIYDVSGRLKYRYSYNQNIYYHSIEMAWLAGALADELGEDAIDARRASFLHDIGKVLMDPGEGMGGHAVIGAEYAAKYGEKPHICHAVGAHHDEYKPETILDDIVKAADALSGGRPGARIEAVESYFEKIEQLHKIATSYPGVTQCYAMHAGRELRILVDSQEVGDEQTREIAKNIAAQIEKEVIYPGQIKVIVIRENRATGTAF